MEPVFVLDASVTIAFGLAVENSLYAEKVLESLEHGMAMVPLIWGLEVGNVLLKAERLQRITRADSQLSTYDAAYLHLAMRSGLPLATEDRALLEAAKRCGVGLYLDG